jgi:hypothetical protein
MNRGQALEAVTIARADPPRLIELLGHAGQKRIADSLRAHCRGLPAQVGGNARPDPSLWLRRRL